MPAPQATFLWTVVPLATRLYWHAASLGVAGAGGLGADGARPANAQEVGQRLWRAAGWALLLIVVAITAILLAFWVKRQILGTPKTRSREGVGFTLADLRDMRRDGKITQAEYERTRDRIVHSAQSAIADAAGDDDRPSVDLPRTKDVDLIRDAERS